MRACPSTNSLTRCEPSPAAISAPAHPTGLLRRSTPFSAQSPHKSSEIGAPRDCSRGVDFVGGDPSAGSPTDTLLRLNPPCRISARAPHIASESSPKPNSDGLTGGVCKEQGHIHRGMLTRDYYGIHLRGGELQPPVRTMIGFRDCLHLS